MMIRPSSSTRRAFSTWVVAVEALIINSSIRQLSVVCRDGQLTMNNGPLLLHVHRRCPAAVGCGGVGPVHLPGAGRLADLPADVQLALLEHQHVVAVGG